MTRTVFEPGNLAFSLRASAVAEEEIYKPFLGGLRLDFDRQSLDDGDVGARRDAGQGIDMVIRVASEWVPFADKLTFAERFRGIHFRQRYPDITITERNTKSGMPSERFKLEADYIVYGWFSEPSCPRCGQPLPYGETCGRLKEVRDNREVLCGGVGLDASPCFWEWIIISAPELKRRGFILNELPFGTEQNTKGQTFRTFPLSALEEAGLIVAHGGKQYNAPSKDEVHGADSGGQLSAFGSDS